MLAQSRGHAFATLQGRLRITNARGHSADTGKEPLACTRRTQRGHTVWTAVNRGQNAVTMFLNLSSMHAILREEEKTQPQV